MSEKKKVTAVSAMSPVGRIINQSVFEKDAFKDERGREGTPEYKCEIAFAPAPEGAADDHPMIVFEDAAIQAAVNEWGESAVDEYWDGSITSPFKDGDQKAEERAKRGKNGDFYKGKLVMNAHTQFNRYGENATGGIYVCGPDAKELPFDQRGQVYNGAWGKISVTFQASTVSGERYVVAYLDGLQLCPTPAGESDDRLRGKDPSSLFSPMMGGDSESKGRSRRR